MTPKKMFPLGVVLSTRTSLQNADKASQCHTRNKGRKKLVLSVPTCQQDTKCRKHKHTITSTDTKQGWDMWQGTRPGYQGTYHVYTPDVTEVLHRMVPHALRTAHSALMSPFDRTTWPGGAVPTSKRSGARFTGATMGYVSVTALPGT